MGVMLATLTLAWQSGLASAAAPLEGIKALQCMLNALGYKAGPITGAVTPDTVAAWGRFLQVHGMTAQTDAKVMSHALLTEYTARVPTTARDCSIPEERIMLGRADAIAPPDSLVWERMLRSETVCRLTYMAAQERWMPQKRMQGLTGRYEPVRQGWPRYWDPRD
jgi:peptidoglycan hydrolase-like protein with peptidoglycan-binding domain